jgi:hypothetical protein
VVGANKVDFTLAVVVALKDGIVVPCLTNSGTDLATTIVSLFDGGFVASSTVSRGLAGVVQLELSFTEAVLEEADEPSLALVSIGLGIPSAGESTTEAEPGLLSDILLLFQLIMKA